MAERETLSRDLVTPAGGMSVVNGQVTENELLYFAKGVSAERPGELARQNGKLATDDIGSPIMGFAQFFSPQGYMTTITQTGYTFTESGPDGSTAGGPPTFPSVTPPVIGSGNPNSPYIQSGIVRGVTSTLSDSGILYGPAGGGPPTSPSAPTQWYGYFSGIAANEVCLPVQINTTIGPLSGESPFSYVLNECVLISACGLGGRGVKIIDANGNSACYLEGAGFYSGTVTFFTQ